MDDKLNRWDKDISGLINFQWNIEMFFWTRFSPRGSAEVVIEKATGEMEKHMCPAELVVKVALASLFVVNLPDKVAD